MKEYNKQQLHEYAKELFALCKSKGIKCEDWTIVNEVIVHFKEDVVRSFIATYNFKSRSGEKGYLVLPIWELIEKVKQL